MRKLISSVCGVVALAAASGAASATVTFTDLELGTSNGTATSKSYSKDGATLNVTTATGAMTHIADGQFAGLWFSQGFIGDAVYTLDFGGAGVTEFEITIDAMSGAVDPLETLMDWTTTGGSASFALSGTSNVDVSGGDLSSLVISCMRDTDDGRFTLTLTSAAPFTAVSFRHVQNPGNNGSVIEQVEFDVVPAPAVATLVPVAGLMLARRRR